MGALYTTCVDAHVVVEPEDVAGSGQQQFELAVTTFKLLGDVTRLKILWALLHGEHSVNDLAAHVGANASAVSQHLRQLRTLGLVTTRRQGNFIYYSCDHPHVRAVTAEALSHARHVTADDDIDHRAPTEVSA
jgi:DNA-binding transcriptional ArsR family regulator